MKPTFKLVVVANNLPWPSLADKIEAVCDFYAPVCTLIPTIVRTSMQPVFNNTYPGLAPLYVVDRGWYDVNVATPYAIQADFILFITPDSDHAGLPTYLGYMSYNNIGPWETTVFAQGENDHTYVQGRDMGNSFVLYAEHELAHAFYAMVGKRDDTHVHFPASQAAYTDDPANVLRDFDLGTQYARLQWLKDQLVGALTALGLLRKRNIATVADTPLPTSTPQPAPTASTFPHVIVKWADAIAVQEGARPELHNPGNLKYAPLTASWGATKGFQAADGGWIAKFPTLEHGHDALCNFLLLACHNELAAFHSAEARTLGGFTKIYAGNPPQNYFNGIVAALGVPATTQISSFL